MYMHYAKHFFRAAILLVLAVTAILVTLRLFVPKSFGKYGNYRGDNLEEQMAKPVVWQSHENEQCGECHPDEVEKKKNSRHSVVRCMDCHGPISAHVKNGEKIADQFINRSWQWCGRCHQYSAARSKVLIHQIDVTDHLAKHNVALTREVCIQCHSPHSPEKK